MALIEGVGDEVTLLFGVLIFLLVLLLAWISTRTSEPLDHTLDSSTRSTLSQRTPHHDTPSTSASESHVTETQPVTVSPNEDKEDRGRQGAAAADGDLGGSDGGGVSQRNMVVRLKFLNDTERTALVKPQDTIGYIKRTYFSGQEQRVRLIYQGQLLQDDAITLESLNLTHNCVLHCHISQHAPRATAGAGPADQVQVALNVGSLMVPLLVLMLSVLWYCQIQYRQFFTAPATASLVGITIFLSLVAFGVYRR
uniref:transmembrane and ubiquitin-like domain-containing protein 1 n=1 Tax=Doryrhamphus excisus TaxID=161450 RepID=UPI0025AE3C98|nr:transmembrane and ubiquitin-like domain-containing protein 1 [Doryrhamphus excisus]XP_057922880.1 transmembrane and ubiquitin-like domain-containing protein 1 [Doryrhamphus excisus]XP_057922881.1 transmembrane and ubiquitin-like domain-containing protein 1 [Doryrhamphus excisus]